MNPFRSVSRFVSGLFTPPSVSDTTAELEAVELEIDDVEDVPDSVRLARAFVGTGEYCLGAGRYQADGAPWTRCANPTRHRHRHAKDARIFSDCSGWLLAMWRHARKLNGRWLNTDEMERLAKLHPVPWADRRPGDGVVYGAGAKIGHCGLFEGRDTVIHCSASGSVAVKRGGLDLWLAKKALVLRPELVVITPPAIRTEPSP